MQIVSGLFLFSSTGAEGGGLENDCIIGIHCGLDNEGGLGGRKIASIQLFCPTHYSNGVRDSNTLCAILSN